MLTRRATHQFCDIAVGAGLPLKFLCIGEGRIEALLQGLRLLLQTFRGVCLSLAVFGMSSLSDCLLHSCAHLVHFPEPPLEME